MPALRRLTAAARALRPDRTSVVVAVDDDNAPVVGDCLEALRAQLRRPEEVLVVDTGTLAVTARTLRDAVASTMPDVVRVLTLPSVGKAEALRHGLHRATGTYAMLIDAGDVLTPTALGSLTGSLRRSGSALALPGPAEAGGVTLAGAPHAAADPDLATVLLRTAVVRIEPVDGPLLDWLPVLRLLLEHRFDLVPDRVRARPRQGGSAFGTMPARSDAVPAWSRAVLEVMADPRSTPARGTIVRWLLTTPVLAYLDDAERCTDATWHQLRDTVGRLMSAAPEALADVPASARAYAWLASNDRRDDTVELGVRRWASSGSHPTRVESGRVFAVLPVPDLPDDVVEMHAGETPVVARPWRLLPSRDGMVRLDVRAYIKGVGEQHGPLKAALVLVSPDGSRHELWTQLGEDPDVNRWAQEPFQGHTLAHLTGHGRLPASAGPVGAGWQLEVSLSVAGVVRRATAPGPVRRTGEEEWRVSALGLVGTGLMVSGEGTPASATSLELRGPQGQLGWRGTVGSPFTAQLALEHDSWGLGPAPLPSGGYRLVVPDGPLRLEAGPTADLLRSGAYRIAVEQGPRAVRLLVGPALADDETGAWSQHRLQRWYASCEQVVDPGLVLLQSYTGQSCTDSPRAIHDALRRRRPDLRLVWAVADGSTRVPPGGRAVPLRSREWYRTLATAGHLVINIDMDRWFVKRPGQRLLQTYHGYPSKTMGISAWQGKNLTPRRIQEQLRRTSGTWDLLLTPTPAMDVHYRRQYRYEGPIHSYGYPRDDALVGPEAGRNRTEVRSRLGLGDRTVVLYAPTWRDDLATDFRAAPLAGVLDAGALVGALGDDVTLLLRGHRFHRHRELADDRLVDVTDYPEINDLVLAADVAVLDYSSLRFDFALTGRPMVFLVPDLQRYERGVRGFLYDFRTSAPGPLVDTTDEVVDALRDLPALRSRYAEQLTGFNAAFNPYQDGAAADRVVDAFFGPRPL